MAPPCTGAAAASKAAGLALASPRGRVDAQRRGRGSSTLLQRGANRSPREDEGGPAQQGRERGRAPRSQITAPLPLSRLAPLATLSLQGRGSAPYSEASRLTPPRPSRADPRVGALLDRRRARFDPVGDASAADPNSTT